MDSGGGAIVTRPCGQLSLRFAGFFRHFLCNVAKCLADTRISGDRLPELLRQRIAVNHALLLTLRSNLTSMAASRNIPALFGA